MQQMLAWCRSNPKPTSVQWQKVILGGCLEAVKPCISSACEAMYASLSFHYQVLLLLAILFLQGVDTQRVLCRKMSLSLPRIENNLNSFLCIVYFLYLICMLFLYLHFVCIWNCHSLLNMYKAAVTENITSNCLY